MIIPFAVQAYTSASLPLSAQCCVNAYAEMQQPNAKTPVAVFQTPGIRDWANVGSGPIRKLYTFKGLLYAVSGDRLYRIASDGTGTQVGSGILGSGRLGMADNGTQIVIVNGVQGWVYTVAGGLASITDPDFTGAKTVTFVNSYFAFDRAGTNQFFISDLLDGTSYDALNFASAESSPDNVVGVIRRKDNLLIVGASTAETMYDDPVQEFPFTRIGGSLIDRGCIAPYSIIAEDNAVFWLGNDRCFYRVEDILPKRISTHALEAAWRQYDVVDDAFCDAVVIDGHKFIVLTFPSEPATFVYDIATGLWHEKVSWDANNASYERWRGNTVAECYGYQLVGDLHSGRVGIIDPATYTEWGNTLQVRMVSPFIHEDRRRLFHSSLELDMETGVGLTTGQGSDPQVMLRHTDDGARTFSLYQHFHSMGKIGEYRARVRWTRLGSSYTRAYELTKSDPTRFVLYAAHADIAA